LPRRHVVVVVVSVAHQILVFTVALAIGHADVGESVVVGVQQDLVAADERETCAAVAVPVALLCTSALL
jgi:hypothetical protein